MSSLPPFGVHAWVAWRPGTETLSHGGAATGEGELPAALRRRVTPIGRRALSAAMAALAGLDSPRIVLSSRHGEYQRTKGLLNSLAEEGAVSPADFSMSVHHALAGLLSIATGNREGHTAVAGGRESFGYGLLEAAASLAESGRPVLLVHFDEPLPEEYADCIQDDEPPMAMAMSLVRWDGKGQAVAVEATPPAGEPPPLIGSLSLDFIDFLSSGIRERKVGSERMGWRWLRVG